MIGQENLKKKFMELIKENKLPKVNILIGSRGCGKKEFIKWLSEQTSTSYKLFGNKIEDVKSAIETSLNEYTNQFYVFESIEKQNGTMNKPVQNAILKFLEEPPKNVVIFLLCQEEDLLLTTVHNRGIITKFEGYKREELEYFTSNKLALELFNCPGDIITYKDANLEELVSITGKIIDKLDIANISNALKLNSYVKTKYANEDGYEIDLFIKALKYSFYLKYKETKDENIRRKFYVFLDALNQVKVNEAFFMNTFIINNYKEIKQWN